MKKLLAALAILTIAAATGLYVFVHNFDANRYRAQIAEELSAKMGRRIGLGGPIKMNLSFKGATLDIRNVEIGNPPWASRPVMAKIGHFDLAVSLPALLGKRLIITGVDLTNADIDLEAESNGRDNWEFRPEESGTKSVPAKTATSPRPVSVRVDKLAVTNSNVTFYNRNGEASDIRVEHLKIDNEDGAALHMEAQYNGVPVALNVQAGVDNLLEPSGTWPFSADMTYANYKVTAEGQTDLDTRKASISFYEIRAGGSRVNGDLTADWSKSVPTLRGSMTGDSLTPSDFALTDGKENGGSVKAPPPEPRTRVFSDVPLGLDGLKAIDVALNVNIGEVVLPGATFKKVAATVKLDNGFLTVDPLTALLGKGTVNAKLRVDGAASPYQASVVLSAANVPLDDLMQLIGAPSFLSGTSTLDANLATSGDTAHAMASHALGIFSLVAAGGNVSSSLAHDISSVLMDLFAPAGSSDLNCLATRFIVKNGVAQSNGILIDTGAATVAGKGDVDLGKENLDILLHARAKVISLTGQLLPAAYVGGTFTNPHFSVNPGEVLQNVQNLVLNGSSDANVPQMLSAPGKNACLYTLENPTPQNEDVTKPGLLNRATDSINNITGTLKGLFGH